MQQLHGFHITITKTDIYFSLLSTLKILFISSMKSAVELADDSVSSPVEQLARIAAATDKLNTYLSSQLY